MSDNEYKRAQQKAHYQGKSDLFQQLYGKRGLNNGRSKDRQFQNRKNLLRERANPEKRLYNAANTIKRDATLEELKLLVKHLETLV